VGDIASFDGIFVSSTNGLYYNRFRIINLQL
jgi:hypothetical protein